MKIARLGESPEIFHSLQGEGVSMGRPAVFLRLAFCNLHCSWCDTAYSWKWTPGEKEKHLLELDEEAVAELIRAYPVRHLVITGGEPLLQDDAVCRLVALLPDYSFEIETNGTLIPSPALATAVGQFNVSPKLQHSGNDPCLSLNERSLAWFAAEDKAWFKFVVAEPGDMEEILSLQQKYQIAPDRILLMPRGTSADELSASRLWLAEECIKRGFRLTDRLHVHLWGSKPGV